jgi:ferredoxin/flavodoxin---NADP+ reductase
VSAMYPEKLIYDVAGFAAVRGRDLVAGLAAQAARYQPVYALSEQAVKLEREPDGVLVTAASGLQVRARFVVITGGIGTFTPRRLPALRGHEGRGVVYFVPDPEEYRDKDVAIVGGGDSAFDWALTLAPLARSVTVVHRRETFRAHEALVQQVRDLGVPIITSAEVAAAYGDDGLEAIDLLDKPTRAVRRLDTHAVVAALGFTANIGPLQAWGLDIEDRRIVVDSTMAASTERVYAAGDIATYPGKVRLISVGFGEAATAVHNAAVVLDPTASLFPGHSTDAEPARP